MWQIDHQCPQCGAPVTLEETERLFVCPYCRVRLYISSDDMLRYYMSPTRTGEQIVYVPYWRTKGIDFVCHAAGVTTRVIDRTTLAHRASCFPYSLGVRLQVFNLRFVGPTVEQALLPATIPLGDAETTATKPTGFVDDTTDSASILFRVALREVESLIFSPVSLEGDMLYDAISGKNLGQRQDEVPIETPAADRAGGKVSFIPALCPDCGADLAGEKESITLYCGNCQQVFSIEGGSLRSAGTAFVAGPQDAIYLPFWFMEAQFEGLENAREPLSIDTVKTGRIGARPVRIDEPHFSFWLPAFKVNAALLLTLAERATAAQPGTNGVITEAASHLYPVTLPAREAAKLVKVVIALLIGNRTAANPDFVGMTVRPKEPRLGFIPFSSSGHELVNERMRMAVHPNALKYGRNL